MSFSNQQIQALLKFAPPQLDDNLFQTVKLGFGWISPDGKIIPVELMDHLKIVREHFPELALKYEKGIEDFKIISLEIQEEWGDGPGGGHIIDQYLPETIYWVYKQMFNAGWVRIVIEDIVHCEGSEAGIKYARRHIRDICLAAQKDSAHRILEDL